jgi:23S rRNA (pseudouridine1915-N3)-methyltransferase
MRVHLLAIGRAKGAQADLYADYARRLTWPLSLREIDLRGAASQTKESEALLAAIPAGAKVVVCDERGKSPDSAEFAARLGKWQDDGVRDVAFLIGGADGHTGAVRERADFLISFGKLTWPHMLARIMLIEQIYRAQQILAGHPYHRA